MPQLCVNIDHVATLRNARAGVEPEPVTAMAMSEMAGAHGIIVHLREDRRHITDRDVVMIRDTTNTRLNLEMAATEEMRAIALDIGPETVCLVPEKRQELTTEGGLAVAGRVEELKAYMAPLWEAGILTSLFIDADPEQVEAAAATGTQIVEIHTGHYADARGCPATDQELKKVLSAISHARELGLSVNLGHGLNYTNIYAFKDVPDIMEYSIGHSIMARAIFLGLDRAVRDMVEIIRSFEGKPMIRGLGIDLTEIERIRESWERFGERFAGKVLTEKELSVMRTRRNPVPYLAALWAAKEAAVKALGTGFADGVHLKTVQIEHLPSGKPEISFLGRALEVANNLGVSSVHVSLTHERGMAGAVVVIEGE